MATKLEIYRQMIDASLAGDAEGFLAHVTDDVEYHYHMTSRPLLGREWVAKFLRRYEELCADPHLEIHHHAENGDCLFVEGYEEYTDRRSGKRVAHPFVGVIEFRDGRVSKWRDYFEMNNTVEDAAAAGQTAAEG